ncbi:MAG: hypothetical protein IK123_05440, partial [Lachnospiraceae bacterium]|nr:hypothetical protein [Lachnospiraceae bacterium]
APDCSYEVENDKYDEGKARKLLVNYSGKASSTPYVYYKYDITNGFAMKKNDPISNYYLTDNNSKVYYDNGDQYNYLSGKYSDKTYYHVKDDKAAGSNSRINVFRDIDPRFVNDFLPKQSDFKYSATLDAPTGLSIDVNHPSITLSWNGVTGAAAYELSYRITDNEKDNDNIVEESGVIRLGGDTTSYSINNKEAWNAENVSYSISFSIKAISEVQGKDSQEAVSDSAIISLKTLPTPQVHLELTPDNKMAAVLDNREVSVENGGYKKSDGTYIDCNVEVAYDAGSSAPYEYTIPVSGNAVSVERHEVKINEKNGQDTLTYKPQLKAKARPTVSGNSVSNNSVSANDIYIESDPAEISGMLADNYTLVNGDPGISEQDKGSTYFNYSGSDRLVGFRGDDYRNTEYVIQYSDAETREAVMMEDITAYDKKLGVDVTIAKEETITTGQTAQVKSIDTLPDEWFGEDAPESLLVRSYLAKSQNEVVHYGHTVSENVILDKDTPEENRAVLAGISDPYYLGSGETAVNSEHSIWDAAANNGEGDLKPGYVLIRKTSDDENSDDGSQKITYTVYYNAALELAEKNAGDGQEYSKYDVTYKRYDTGLKDTVIEQQREDTDPEDARTVRTAKTRTAAAGSDDRFNDALAYYQEAYGINRGSDHISARAYQDISPAPIMDGKIRWSEDEEGNETYTVRWDQYYRNNEVWNNGKDPVEEKDLIDGYKWYQTDNDLVAGEEDRYAAPTWTAFADKTGYYDEATTDGVRKDIMNAYLMTYSGRADEETGEDETGTVGSGYTVEVIGYDDNDPDNKKVLLSRTGSEDIQLTKVDDYYTRQNYKYKEVENEELYAPRYSKWVYETSFTKDPEWNYDRYEIRIVSNGTTKCLVSSLGDSIGSI